MYVTVHKIMSALHLLPGYWLEVSISIGCAVVSCLVCTVVVVLSVLLSSYV
jgi:hypothetical protein